MFIAVSVISGCAGIPDPAIENKKLNTKARLQLASIIGDALLFITTLAIGILGAVGVLNGMPPAAAYSLLALSGAIALTWIGLIILGALAGEPLGILRHSKNLFQAACSSDPNLIQ